MSKESVAMYQQKEDGCRQELIKLDLELQKII